MTARYHIVVDSPLGERRGELTLNETAEGIAGSLSLLGWENPLTGTRKGDGLRLEHRLHTLVSDLSCTTTLRPVPGGLTATVQAGRVRMALRATEITTETEESDHHGRG